MADEYEDNDDAVEARSRFLTDQTAQKILYSLVSMYAHAAHPDDDTIDDLEIPEIGRNTRVLLLNGIFDLLEEHFPVGDDEEDIEDGEEYASVARVNPKAARLFRAMSREIAKDKRMSEFYKSFMGEMGKLTAPWHEDKNEFLQAWTQMGMKLYASSPADATDPQLKAQVVVNRDDTEEAATLGSESALPTKVMRAIAEMGFTAVSQPHSSDSAWVKTGDSEGFFEKAVYLIRRDDNSYIVQLSQVNKHDPYGKRLKHKVLDDETSSETILRTVAYMYDAMTQT